MPSAHKFISRDDVPHLDGAMVVGVRGREAAGIVRFSSWEIKVLSMYLVAEKSSERKSNTLLKWVEG